MTTRRVTRRSYLPTLLVFASSLVVLAVLNPHLLFVANTPTGGDMGAHVLGPAYLRDVLLPQGRILGWSDSWFAGFPAFYFYFPLPSLFIVFLDLFLPYGVAFKLVTTMGLIGLPPAAAFMIRCFGGSRQLAAVGAAGAVAFALMESFTIYGANVASTMAGEFAYSWSFSLGLVYLGLLGRAIDDRRQIRWAALVLGLTALSHILTTIVLVIASLPVLFRRRAWRPAISVWAWGFAIAGFWAVPVLARIGLTADMGWNPLSRWEEIFPIELWFPLPLALIGMVMVARRYPRSRPLLIATLMPIVYYPLPTLLPQLIPALGEDRWKLWNGRLLPYWHFGVNFFAALAVGLGLAWLARRLPERLSPWWARIGTVVTFAALGALLVFRDGPVYAGIVVGVVGLIIAGVMGLVSVERIATKNLLAGAGVLVIAVGALAGTNFVYKWSAWNYSGYEAKTPFSEYDGLMQTVDGLPPGRIQWEQDSTDGTGLSKYGTPMAPMLFPYWTEWTHPSMEGLFFESSLTTPFMFLASNEMSLNGSTPVSGLDYHEFDFDRGIPHMQQYGVRYYVAYSSEAADKADVHPDLTRVAVSPTLPDLGTPTDLVAPATSIPVVFQGAVPVDPEDGSVTTSVPLAIDGPEEWQRVASFEEISANPTGASASDVSQIEINDAGITFSTTAVGIPHFVDVPLQDNWAVVGGDGPYKAFGDGLFIVPTESDVTIEFRPRFSVYELPEVNLVEPVAFQPSVFEQEPGGAIFDEFAFEWYGSIETLDQPVVPEGPDDWPKVSSVEELPDIPTGATPEAVTNVVFGDHRIAFDTTAIGVPHLVKMSYFPNWTADGAEGPYRATPTVMLVVPTQQHVEMEFGSTWAEITGNVLTIVGSAGLVLAFWSRRRSGKHTADA